MKGRDYLKTVYLSADVYAICLQHALSTEKEEIMGLLIGEINHEEYVSHISACVILHRSDKQPDRVEISPEQLCLATTHAEQLTKKLNRTMKIVGWYHSHPHITVWPSHVDVRTQANYQVLDSLFVGLIFSVYQSEKGNKENQVQLTCFQASKSYSGTTFERREVEILIEKSPLQLCNLEGIANLPRILTQEENQLHEGEQNSSIRDDLATLHNDAFKTVALVHVVSKIARPLCDDLESRRKATIARIEKLQELKRKLCNEF